MKREEWQTNRELKRSPKGGKFWCLSCDMCYVRQGQRCKKCGKRDMRYNNKK